MVIKVRIRTEGRQIIVDENSSRDHWDYVYSSTAVDLDGHFLLKDRMNTSSDNVCEYEFGIAHTKKEAYKRMYDKAKPIASKKAREMGVSLDDMVGPSLE